MADLIGAVARNLAAWHDTSVRALGLRTAWSERLWICLDPAPFIYHAAITLAPPATATRAEIVAFLVARREGPLSVCDAWDRIDLTDVGLRRAEPDAWYVRTPESRPPGADPRELAIEEVRDSEALAEFEMASIDGFQVPLLHSHGSLGVHAAGILDDPRMRVYVGRVAERVVSAAMAYVGDAIVGVYGVATLPAFRRHGYGEALARRATLADPRLPAVLQPSALGLSTYIRLGYREIGGSQTWLRLAAADTPPA